MGDSLAQMNPDFVDIYTKTHTISSGSHINDGE